MGAGLINTSQEAGGALGLVYLQLTPTRLQVWRSMAELGGRTLMSSGRWLV